MPMQAFFMKQNWDSQSSVFAHPLLQGVSELGHGARSAVFAWSRHLAQAIFQYRCCAIREKCTFFIHEQLIKIFLVAAVLPCTFQLRNLFFLSLTSYMIGDALLVRKY